MPGYDEPLPVTSTPMTPAITDLARSVADIYSLLSDMAAQRQWPMPPFLTCGMSGYDTTLLPFQDAQPTVQQIKQATDITTEPARKMLTCKVSAVREANFRWRCARIFAVNSTNTA
jgi:hypothetical protein